MPHYKFWYIFYKKYGFCWLLNQFIQAQIFNYEDFCSWIKYKQYCYSCRIRQVLNL